MKTLVSLLLVCAVSGIWHLADSDSAANESGQDVYVAEGCIHCHSQFSRPNGLDTEIYGTATLPGANDGAAVLIGNRRQGPDLSSVGLRRSRAWNREHLIDPQLVSPGSRMPSYRHLFAGEGERGEALLDYLSGLGVEGAAVWFERTGKWKLGGEEGDTVAGKELFRQLCSNCHGAKGAGDGVLVERFQPRPTNFAEGAFRFAALSLPVPVRREQLGRIVKYGLPGTPMAGHEYLTDEQVADLVAYVSEFPVRIATQE